jgi:lactoylglutathione lyase
MPEPALTLLVLKTRKVEQLRQFYQTLGIKFVKEQHGKGPVHYAGQACGIVIEIYPVSDDALIDASIRLGFAVENLAETVRALEPNRDGTTSPSQSSGVGLHALVRDPDGRAVELSQIKNVS